MNHRKFLFIGFFVSILIITDCSPQYSGGGGSPWINIEVIYPPSGFPLNIGNIPFYLVLKSEKYITNISFEASNLQTGIRHTVNIELITSSTLITNDWDYLEVFDPGLYKLTVDAVDSLGIRSFVILTNYILSNSTIHFTYPTNGQIVPTNFTIQGYVETDKYLPPSKIYDFYLNIYYDSTNIALNGSNFTLNVSFPFYTNSAWWNYHSIIAEIWASEPNNSYIFLNSTDTNYFIVTNITL